MTLRTLLLYLLGNREAILVIARTRGAWLLGACFVFSAAFARDYDGVDLQAQPWHLGIPFVASFLAALLLYTLCLWSGPSFAYPDPAREPESTKHASFLSFLALFWLTAPMAWLYAIPFERYLGPLEAVKANFASLAMVSVWRVALMIRVLVVLMNFTVVGAIMTVLLAAGIVVFLFSITLTEPVFVVMGGMRRQSEITRFLAGISQLACCPGALVLPVMLGVWFTIKQKQDVRWKAGPAAGPRLEMSWSLVAVAAVAVWSWAFVLPLTQPEQRLKTQAKKLLYEGDARAYLTFLAGHGRDEFPPHWEPPPLLGGGIAERMLFDRYFPPLLPELAARKYPDWIHQTMLDKVRWLCHPDNHLNPGDYEKWWDAVANLPERTEIRGLLRKRGDSNWEEFQRQRGVLPIETTPRAESEKPVPDPQRPAFEPP